MTTISRVAPAIPATAPLTLRELDTTNWADFLSGSGCLEFTPVEPEAVEITAAKNAASDAIKEVLRARHVAYVEAMEAHQAKLEAIRAQEVFPRDLTELDTDELSMQELEAAVLEAPYGKEFDFFFDAWQERLELAAGDERVVTGDDGLDHYL